MNLKLLENKKLIKIYFALFPEIIMNNHTYKLEKFIKDIVFNYDNDKEGKILDAGAGECPHKKYFRNLKYYSQDIKNNSKNEIDYISDITSIPVNSRSFDYILCSQVMEHIKTPHKAFREFGRILKKNGILFLSTHMAYEEHMIPHDYFRYTRYGLEYLAESNNFKVIKIEPVGGRFLVLSKEIQLLIPRILNNKYLTILYFILFSIPLFFLSLIMFLLDYFDKQKTLTLNYQCIFIKK